MALSMVTRRGAFDMQVCVPADWTDAQVLDFAESQNPCGTSTGWAIRREGDPSLAGDPERMPCAKSDNVHVMLDA